MGILFNDATPDYFTNSPRFVSAPPLTLFAIHSTDDASTFPQYLLCVGTSQDWWALYQSKDLVTAGMVAETKRGFTRRVAVANKRYSGWVASCAVFVSNTSRKIYTYSPTYGFATATAGLSATFTLTSGSNRIGCDGGNANPYSGIISVAGFWNIALSAAEATGLVMGYYNPRHIQLANLVGYCSMKHMDGSGDILNFMDGCTFTNTGAPSIVSGGPENLPGDYNFRYKKVPKGLPDSSIRMNRRKLIEQVF